MIAPEEMDDAELLELAHTIAYEDSVVLLESCTVPDGEPGWFDLSDGSVDDAASEAVLRAVRYLEARGLVERDPSDDERITVLDESEAVR